MGKSWIILQIAVFCSLRLAAQQVQYTLYDFAAQRTNPAAISLDNFASVDGIYRSQQSLAGVALSSALFSAKYPFIQRRRGRWSAVGLTVGHDRAGLGGLLQLNEVTAVYALTLRSNRTTELSAGVQAGYRQRRVSGEGLYTGRQYIDNEGFDLSLDPGENLSDLAAVYASLGAGISWKLKDRRGERRGHAGLAVQELNTPSESVLGNAASPLPLMPVAEGGLRLLNERRVAVYADVLYARTRSNYFNSGITTTYKIGRYHNPKTAQTIDFIARYLPKMGAMAGVRWNNGQTFSLAAGYEVPVNAHPAHQGAFEVGLRVARLEKAKPKRRRKPPGKGKRPPYVPGRRAATPPGELLPRDTVVVEIERRELPEDSVPGRPKPVIDGGLPQKILLRYDFDFGEITPVLEKQDILEEIVDVLRKNPAASIEIIGHTDNVGSERFNQRLSEERARVFFELLTELGIDPSRMDYRGEGELQPLNDNSTSELQRLNRRVEVVFHYLERGGR